MEEHVGMLWHRLLNRATTRRFPEAAVKLSEISLEARLLFRSMGGDHGVPIQAGEQTRHGARMGLLQRLAGSGDKADLAWVDERAVRLPPVIDAFPQAELNRDLYLWLASLCGIDREPDLPWIARNQAATLSVIRNFPGLAARYARLVEAEIGRRPPPERLPMDEARQEHAIRTALRHPGSVSRLPVAGRPPHPVLLWMRPVIAPPAGCDQASSMEHEAGGAEATQRDDKRRSARHTAMPDRKGGLLIFRPESIFSWTEYARIDHETQENQDPDLANGADDLDTISIARDRRSSAKRLRMELDIPQDADGETALDGGTLLPEWDYRTRTLKAGWCRIHPLPPAAADPCPLPPHLNKARQRIQRQFSVVTPVRRRLKGEPEGNEVDIDSYIRHLSQGDGTDGRFFLDIRKRERDIASLLLADFSLSTEAWVGNGRRVIDVIQDSLFLFSEAMSVIGDRFALCGFSSKSRSDIRFRTLKSFGEPYNDVVRGRIQGIGPEHYTRMGAAVRQAAGILERQRARDRLLLLLTDGKPNDVDQYEGRYGIEDTRQALATARQQGLRAFCVTIDREGHTYLPRIFGKNNFIVIRSPSELPSRLPLLYGVLTR